MSKQDGSLNVAQLCTFLKEVDIFAKMDIETLERIVERLQKETFNAGKQ